MEKDKLDECAENFRKHLASLTDEEKENLLPKIEPIPLGWLSIEEHLPAVTVGDFLNNNALIKIIKVKDKDGNEFMSQVGDHMIWYYGAKEVGITHWLNE